jgi:hypothetical protein
MAILPDDPKKGKEKERALGSSVMDGVAEKLLHQRITDAGCGRLKSFLHDPAAIIAVASDIEAGHHNEEGRKFIDLLNRHVLPAPAAGLISLFLIRALRRGIDATAWSRMTRSTTFGAVRQQQQRDRANNATSKFPQSPFRQKDRNNNNGRLMEKRQHNTRIFGEETGPPPASFLGWYNTFTWVLDSLFSLQLAQWTFFYFTKERDAALAKILLVSGESAIARELCPVLLDEFRDVKAGYRRRPTSTGSTSDQSFDNAKLQSFWMMHENCRLRANYQRQLQRESGSSVVPPPGVPTIGPHTALDFDEQSDKKHPDEGRSSPNDEEESDDKDS